MGGLLSFLASAVLQNLNYYGQQINYMQQMLRDWSMCMIPHDCNSIFSALSDAERNLHN